MVAQHLPFVQHFTDDGTPTGESNMVSDYTTPDEFWVEPPAASGGLLISRLLFNIEDLGSLNPNTFGAITALTNGVSLEWRDTENASLGSILPHTIKRNADFSQFAYDSSPVAFGAGNEVLVTRYTLSKWWEDWGLFLAPGERLTATCQDDHTGLVRFEITAEGTQAVTHIA